MSDLLMRWLNFDLIDLNTANALMGAKLAPPVEPIEQAVPGSVDIAELVCDDCGGSGLVTRTYEWRGVECDADDQPCTLCEGYPINQRDEE